MFVFIRKIYYNGIATVVNGFCTWIELCLVRIRICSKINFIRRKSSGNRATRPNKFCVIFAHSISSLCAFAFSHEKKLSNKPLIRLKRYLSRYFNMSHTWLKAHNVVALFSVGNFDMFVNSI